VSNLKALALEEAVLNIVQKRVADALKTHREKVQEVIEDTDTERQGVRLPDGTKVASISAVNPDPKPTVDDEDAFVAWVAKHHPDEVTTRRVLVTEVRPAFMKTLLETMTERKAAEAVTAGGEIVEVPGVTMKEGTRTHTLRFEDGDAGRAAVVAALSAGQFRHLDGIRELTAGGAE
jgi:hypothetical protein